MIVFLFIPQTKLREGDVITPVCHGGGRGGGVGFPACITGHMTWCRGSVSRGRRVCKKVGVPASGGGVCSWGGQGSAFRGRGLHLGVYMQGEGGSASVGRRSASRRGLGQTPLPQNTHRYMGY